MREFALLWRHRDLDNPHYTEELPLTYSVTRYLTGVQGGPILAEVEVAGAAETLWELIDRLRYGVELVDAQGERVWWGYLHALRAPAGALEYSVTLEEMANRVSVGYRDPASGETVYTAWAEDADSVATYGRKERRIESQTENALLPTAENERDSELARRQTPTPGITAGSAAGARLELRGWWDTLGWELFEQYMTELGFVAHRGTSNPFAQTTTNQIVAQRFRIPGPLSFTPYLASITVWAQRVGTPATLRFEVQTNGLNQPSGTVIGSGSLVASLVEDDTNTEVTDGRRITLTPDNPVTLAVDTDYWFLLTTTALSDTVYYRCAVNEESDYGGLMKIWNGATWNLRSPDAQVACEIRVGIEASAALKIVVGGGQFIEGVDALDNSTVVISTDRTGTRTRRQEAEAILAAASSQGQRLMARMTRERRVLVQREPARPEGFGARTHYVDGDLRFFYPAGGEIPRHLVPHFISGQWVKLKDVIPAGTDLSRVGDVSQVFIDAAEYFPDRDEVRPEVRVIPPPLGGA